MLFLHGSPADIVPDDLTLSHGRMELDHPENQLIFPYLVVNRMKRTKRSSCFASHLFVKIQRLCFILYSASGPSCIILSEEKSYDSSFFEVEPWIIFTYNRKTYNILFVDSLILLVNKRWRKTSLMWMSFLFICRESKEKSDYSITSNGYLVWLIYSKNMSQNKSSLSTHCL